MLKNTHHVEREMTLMEKLDNIVFHAEEILKEEGGIQLAVFPFCDWKDMGYCKTMCVLPPDIVPMRREAIRALGNELSHDKDCLEVDAIGLISEVWLSVLDKGEYDKLAAEGKSVPLPSTDPKRQEGIIVAILSAAGEQIVRFYSKKNDKMELQREVKSDAESNEKEQTIQPASGGDILNEFWSGYMHINNHG